MTTLSPENFPALCGPAPVQAPAGLSNRARIVFALIADAAHAVRGLPALRTLSFEVGSEAATRAAMIECQLAGALVWERRGCFARVRVPGPGPGSAWPATLWTAQPGQAARPAHTAVAGEPARLPEA